MNNCALAVNTALATVLLKIWDADRKTLAEGHLSGLSKC